ncbi:hypothetical protein C8R43DRAFT_1135952 [Mycena crocata]|nr:hypothetical protein C8R43DRAFT_1135952 [Mycena crocata]
MGCRNSHDDVLASEVYPLPPVLFWLPCLVSSRLPRSADLRHHTPYNIRPSMNVWLPVARRRTNLSGIRCEAQDLDSSVLGWGLRECSVLVTRFDSPMAYNTVVIANTTRLLADDLDANAQPTFAILGLGSHSTESNHPQNGPQRFKTRSQLKSTTQIVSLTRISDTIIKMVLGRPPDRCATPTLLSTAHHRSHHKTESTLKLYRSRSIPANLRHSRWPPNAESICSGLLPPVLVLGRASLDGIIVSSGYQLIISLCPTTRSLESYNYGISRVCRATALRVDVDPRRYRELDLSPVQEVRRFNIQPASNLKRIFHERTSETVQITPEFTASIWGLRLRYPQAAVLTRRAQLSSNLVVLRSGSNFTRREASIELTCGLTADCSCSALLSLRVAGRTERPPPTERIGAFYVGLRARSLAGWTLRVRALVDMSEDGVWPELRFVQTRFITGSTTLGGRSFITMVLGPNGMGSGKSSIACAICLARHWSPEIIGRATGVDSLIKNGVDTGSIEIGAAEQLGMQERTAYLAIAIVQHAPR